MNFDSHNSPSDSGAAAIVTELGWLENDAGDRFPIQAACSLGRSATNQVVLAGDRISRRHAMIHWQGAKGFWLTDFGSINGTYLNGRRVAQATRLYDQDQITIGQYVFTLRHPRGTVRPRPELTLTEATIREVKTIDCWLLLADLESSTQLTRSLPPAEVPRVISRWLDTCKELIEENGGSINKYLGDGLLAYWPHDGKTARAVAHTLTRLKEAQSRLETTFRIVAHYGQVSVGGVPTMGEESLMGAEVNFAFRMEKLAGSLGVLRMVSQSARELLKGHVGMTEAGSHALSGFAGAYLFYEF